MRENVLSKLRLRTLSIESTHSSNVTSDNSSATDLKFRVITVSVLGDLSTCQCFVDGQ